MRKTSFAGLVLCLSAAGAAAAPLAPETLEAAVAAEILRSTTSLRQEGYPPPYYLGVRVSDVRKEEARCTLGGSRFRTATRQLLATPDVRVGSFELDNQPLAPTDRFEGRELPDVDDPLAVRHSLWLKLDEEYKQAAADFLRKQALRVRRGKTEYDTDDRSKESPLERPADAPEGDFDSQQGLAESRCRALSEGLGGYEHLLGSYGESSRESERDWFFDSDGARVRYARRWARLEAAAQAMTADGMRVNVFRSFMAPTVSRLPEEAALKEAAKEMLADLAALRAASSTSPFNAPALIDPSVGGALLQAMAARLSGEEQRNPEGAQTFRDKLGKLVLPESITLEDDPTLAEHAGVPLVGHYLVDDQGVPASKVTLVERGVLRGFLLSRMPVIGFSRSNGHGRATPGHIPMGRASNLILRSEQVLGEAALLERLRQEAARRGKPYALYIRKTRSWSQQDKAGQQQAFRLRPTLVYLVDAKTGAQQLVRDLDMVGTPLDLLGRVLAAGDDSEVTQGLLEQPSGSLPVSTVCPTLLLGEVELQRAETKPEKPLVLPPPR